MLYFAVIIIAIQSFNSSDSTTEFVSFTFNNYLNMFDKKSLNDSISNSTLSRIIRKQESNYLINFSQPTTKYKYIYIDMDDTFTTLKINNKSVKFRNRVLHIYQDRDPKTKKFINELLYIPIVIPEIVLGISLLCIYAFLKIELGMFTLILSHIAFSIPFVIINVNSVLDMMNPNLEEAASDLGASKLKTFFHVVLPSLVPGIFSGAQLAFTLSLDDVVISYFTAGPESNTLPLQVFSMIKTGVTPDVNALITVMLLIIFVTLFTSMSLSLRRMKKEVNV